MDEWPNTTCSNPRCARKKLNVYERCPSCQALPIGALVRFRYKVQRMVGKGGFGITYLVSDQDLFGEIRILKQLCLEPLAGKHQELINATAERLFKREADVLLKLQHPSIPKLYAYFIEGDYSFLVQDFVSGRTLAEEVKKNKIVFNEQEAFTVLYEIADILEYLHTHTPPIIHRDIKPENLMRHADGRLMLIDFGAVFQMMNSAASSQTLIYSPGYTPPEQIAGHPLPQSDLYAAGATILRLLTGGSTGWFFNRNTGRIEWESYVKTSPQFAAILNTLLVEDANKRLGSATELKKRLKELGVEPKVKIEAQLSELFASPNDEDFFHNISELSPTMIYYEASELSGNSQTYLAPKPPDETGDLKQVPILFLLQRFYRQRLNGLLTCSNGDITKTVHFNQGKIIFADSTLKTEQLDEILTRMGGVNPSDLEKLESIMLQNDLPIGYALVRLGCITIEELRQFIATHISNIVYSLFDWTTGQYEIRLSTKETFEEPAELSLSTADIIFEGLRRMEKTTLIKEWLGDFKRKLTTTSDPVLLYQAIKLHPQEAFIISHIANVMSIEEILALGSLPEAEMLKMLCGLLAVGTLEWIDESDSSDQFDAVPASPMSELDPLPPDFDIQAVATFCYEVEKILYSIEDANHYTLLGVEREASDEEIREAYAQMLKKFHPNRNAQLANYNPSLKVELEKICARIGQAYLVLTDPTTRDKYDREMRSPRRSKFTKTDIYSTKHRPN